MFHYTDSERTVNKHFAELIVLNTGTSANITNIAIRPPMVVRDIVNIITGGSWGLGESPPRYLDVAFQICELVCESF